MTFLRSRARLPNQLPTSFKQNFHRQKNRLLNSRRQPTLLPTIATFGAKSSTVRQVSTHARSSIFGKEYACWTKQWHMTQGSTSHIVNSRAPMNIFTLSELIILRLVSRRLDRR